MIQQAAKPFEIALDIGHSSIGWAVFQNREKFDLLGTGVVLFPANDCLAIERRAYRRQRRHVRATRQRIERLKGLLHHAGALSEVELNKPGCAWPWKLAAEVLNGSGRRLTWPELWDVLRWYAHNRGYDGNARWRRSEDADPEDTEKEERAISLMEEHGTKTMAETFCAVLKISPAGGTKASRERFKGLNAAFPRHTVYDEVKRILEKHLGVLPGLTPELHRALVGEDDDAWQAVNVPTARLPKRYKGSYLFGQSIPRFDNRIISSCPITYQRVLAERDDAKRAARDSKVPAKKCREFLLFRWAMILAKLRVNRGLGMEPLTPEERKGIHAVMVREGRLDKRKLKRLIKGQNGARLANNIDTCFLLPRAEEELVLRPDRRKLPKGRAPYTRQVMKQAIREVFEGKQPDEEGNCLYLGEDIKEAQMKRTLEEKTNNHLVRHRVLITLRLLRDIVKSYMGGDFTLVRQITVEVNRDLQAFSGKTKEEIKIELNQMLKDHTSVVKKLEKDLAETNYRVTASLIRKARIAEDLGWTCPYSQKPYGAIDLASGAFDKDHIIPRSLRPSDSLESLVITSRSINAMKGDRTALQFIKELGGKDIDGDPGVGGQKSNLSTEENFIKFVEGLDIKAKSLHRQDADRRKKRKALLLIERYEEKDFLPKDLTQTSHVVQLAKTEIEKEFKGMESKPRILSLHGSITGEVRKRWQLYGCLAAHNPRIEDLLKRERPEGLNVKRELREITHLHHALDACVIGCASHFLPNDGRLWQALLKRNRGPDENARLVATGIFSRGSEGRAFLSPLPVELSRQITERLGECRVVQHIPKRMTGLAGLKENTRGIVAIEIPDNDAESGKKSKVKKFKEIWNNKSKLPIPTLGDLDGVVVHLQQYGARDPKNCDKRKRMPTKENAWKLLGLQPPHGGGKLRAINGVRVVESNFGLALWKTDGKRDGEVQMRIILWHKVWPQLNEIAQKENGGKWPEVLRAGQIIHIPKAGARGDYSGYWRIKGAELQKERGMTLKISRVDSEASARVAAKVETLLACGMQAVSCGLTGVNLKE